MVERGMDEEATRWIELDVEDYEIKTYVAAQFSS